jgi:hypothetical protein
MRIANPELFSEIIKDRARRDSLPYIVYCVNCQDVFTLAGKKCSHILDLVFGKAADGIVSLQERHDNTLGVKAFFAKRFGITFVSGTREWDDLELVIPHYLLQVMNKNLISGNDVKEAIWRAEAEGAFFRNTTDDTRICCMEKPVITYWVSFRRQGSRYIILDVYSHRIRIGGG